MQKAFYTTFSINDILVVILLRENDVVSSECDALEHSVMIDSSKHGNKVIIIGIDGFQAMR